MLLAGLNLMKLSAIFITHWHPDHYLGLPGLVYTMNFEGRQKPLSVYIPEVEKLGNLIKLGHPSRNFEIVPEDVPVEGSEIKTLLETDSFKVVSIPVEHNVPAVAYGLIEKDEIGIDKEKARKIGLPAQGVIYREIKEKGKAIFRDREIKLEDVSLIKKGKKVVYSGDTKICENLIKLARDADLLIQDCTYFDLEDADEYMHASFKDVVEMVREANVKEVVLTHISRRYKNTKELKKQIQDLSNFKIAEDFMRITI